MYGTARVRGSHAVPGDQKGTYSSRKGAEGEEVCRPPRLCEPLFSSCLPGLSRSRIQVPGSRCVAGDGHTMAGGPETGSSVLLRVKASTSPLRDTAWHQGSGSQRESQPERGRATSAPAPEDSRPELRPHSQSAACRRHLPSPASHSAASHRPCPRAGQPSFLAPVPRGCSLSNVQHRLSSLCFSDKHPLLWVTLLPGQGSLMPPPATGSKCRPCPRSREGTQKGPRSRCGVHQGDGIPAPPC